MGYIGERRSVNSANAIEDLEVPISYIDRNEIQTFETSILNTNDSNHNLINVPVAIWRFVAKDIVGPASRHHTSKYYNLTGHYNMNEIAEKINDIGIKQIKQYL